MVIMRNSRAVLLNSSDDPAGGVPLRPGRPIQGSALPHQRRRCHPASAYQSGRGVGSGRHPPLERSRAAGITESQADAQSGSTSMAERRRRTDGASPLRFLRIFRSLTSDPGDHQSTFTNTDSPITFGGESKGGVALRPGDVAVLGDYGPADTCVWDAQGQ